jgi:hypothetical protein
MPGVQTCGLETPPTGPQERIRSDRCLSRAFSAGRWLYRDSQGFALGYLESRLRRSKPSLRARRRIALSPYRPIAASPYPPSPRRPVTVSPYRRVVASSSTADHLLGQKLQRARKEPEQFKYVARQMRMKNRPSC